MNYFTNPIQRIFGDKTTAPTYMTMGDFEHHKSYVNDHQTRSKDTGHDGRPPKGPQGPNFSLVSLQAWSACVIVALFILGSYVFEIDRKAYELSGIGLIHLLLAAILGKQFTTTALPIFVTVGMFTFALPLFEANPSQPDQAPDTKAPTHKAFEPPRSDPDVIIKDRRAIIPQF